MTHYDVSEAKDSRSTSNIWKIVLLVVVVAALAAAFRFLPLASTLTDFLEYLRGLGVWGPALLVVVYVVATILMAPGLILSLGAGYLFGTLWGTVTISIGSILGATAAFLIGRYASRDFVDGLAKNYPKFAAIDRAVADSGWKIVLLTRLSPLFPFNAINYLYGATQVSLRSYVLASWIGMLPGTIMYVYFGDAAETLSELLADARQGKFEGGDTQQIAFFVGLVITIGVTLFVTRIATKALAEETPGEEVV